MGFDIGWPMACDAGQPKVGKGINMPIVAQELHSRPPFERMMHIHEKVKSKQYLSAIRVRPQAPSLSSHCKIFENTYR